MVREVEEAGAPARDRPRAAADRAETEPAERDGVARAAAADLRHGDPEAGAGEVEAQARAGRASVLRQLQSPVAQLPRPAGAPARARRRAIADRELAEPRVQARRPQRAV